MLRYRIDVSKTNEGGVASLPVEQRDGPWFAAADVIAHVTQFKIGLNNQRILGSVDVSIELIEEWLDAFGVTLSGRPPAIGVQRAPLEIPIFQTVPVYLPAAVTVQLNPQYRDKQCAHGHRRRQVGCVSCVLVFNTNA